jgi:DNA-binding GntR family transcriptional regulator
MNVDISLDRGSPVPLYFQMSQQLQSSIEEGRLKPGDQIDTEMVLAERYGVSRPTVRQAMQDLVNKGLLVRRRGVGTQVVHAPVRRQLGLTSLYDDLREGNRQPVTDVLTFETIPANERVAAALQIAEGSQVRYLERVRCEGSEPLAYMQNWLPVDVLSMEADVTGGGLYAHLRSTGQHPHTAHQRIGAKAANSVEARVLDLRKGSPLLTMERHAFDTAGRPIELGVHAYRADTYAFETTLVER